MTHFHTASHSASIIHIIRGLFVPRLSVDLFDKADSETIVRACAYQIPPGSGMWGSRAELLLEALIPPLVFMRDNQERPFNGNSLSRYFDLRAVEALVYESEECHVPQSHLRLLQLYLQTLPGYEFHPENRGGRKLSSEAREQHGYMTMLLWRIALAHEARPTFTMSSEQRDFKQFLGRPI